MMVAKNGCKDVVYVNKENNDDTNIHEMSMKITNTSDKKFPKMTMVIL